MSDSTGKQAAEAAAEKHRRKVTLIATIAVLVLLAILVWLVQMIVEQQRIERCMASRRPDCFRLDTPQRSGPVDLNR